MMNFLENDLFPIAFLIIVVSLFLLIEFPEIKKYIIIRTKCMIIKIKTNMLRICNYKKFTVKL